MQVISSRVVEKLLEKKKLYALKNLQRGQIWRYLEKDTSPSVP